MKKIKLTRGKYALVDNEDFNHLSQWKWHCTHFGYAARRDGQKIIMMHRQIMQTPEGYDTDHEDLDKLNNQKYNLRVASRSENIINLGLKSNNTSGYKGVSWSKQNKKWWATIGLSGKTKSLGFYDNITDAAEAYRAAAIKYYGKFARPE